MCGAEHRELTSGIASAVSSPYNFHQPRWRPRPRRGWIGLLEHRAIQTEAPQPVTASLDRQTADLTAGGAVPFDENGQQASTRPGAPEPHP